MGKKRKFVATSLDEVDRTMHSTFCSAANSLSQLYTQAMNQQKLTFQAGERHGLSIESPLPQKTIGTISNLKDMGSSSHLESLKYLLYRLNSEILKDIEAEKVLSFSIWRIPNVSNPKCASWSNWTMKWVCKCMSIGFDR